MGTRARCKFFFGIWLYNLTPPFQHVLPSSVVRQAADDLGIPRLYMMSVTFSEFGKPSKQSLSKSEPYDYLLTHSNRYEEDAADALQAGLCSRARRSFTMMRVPYSLSRHIAGICDTSCCLVQSSVHVSRFSIQAMGRPFEGLYSVYCAVLRWSVSYL